MRETGLVSGFWSSIPADYMLRVSGSGEFDVSNSRRFPAPRSEHPLASALLVRTLRLNCLTTAYSDLWSELYEDAWQEETWAIGWPGLQSLNAVGPAWEYDTPLRTERARRSALVEIDALVAVWLGVDEDSLIAMYRARFPVLNDFERVTWFDGQERKIAGNRYTYDHGQTKEHWEQLSSHPDFDDPENPQGYVPDGYVGPLFKADRETEMRSAHRVFSERLRRAQEQE